MPSEASDLGEILTQADIVTAIFDFLNDEPIEVCACVCSEWRKQRPVPASCAYVPKLCAESYFTKTLKLLHWATDYGLDITASLGETVASCDNLKGLVWLFECHLCGAFDFLPRGRYRGWYEETTICNYAALGGSSDCLRYAHMMGCDWDGCPGCDYATLDGHSKNRGRSGEPPFFACTYEYNCNDYSAPEKALARGKMFFDDCSDAADWYLVSEPAETEYCFPCKSRYLIFLFFTIVSPGDETYGKFCEFWECYPDSCGGWHSFVVAQSESPDVPPDLAAHKYLNLCVVDVVGEREAETFDKKGKPTDWTNKPRF